MRNIFRGLIGQEQLINLSDNTMKIKNPIKFFKNVEKESILFMGVDVGIIDNTSFVVVDVNKDIIIQQSGKISIPDLYDNIIYLIELVKPEKIYINVNRDGGFSCALIEQLEKYSNDHRNVDIYYENKIMEKKIRGIKKYEKKPLLIKQYGTYFNKNVKYMSEILKNVIENSNPLLSEELLNDLYRISSDDYHPSLITSYLLALYMIKENKID